MRKYRLKKDTFLAKKGGLFREVNESGAVYLQRIKPEGSDLLTKIAKDPIIDFDEWFEEVRELEEWKPKELEEYKFIDEFGDVSADTFNDHTRFDRHNLTIGNCYPMETPSETIIKEQKLIPQAMHRLKLAAKKAWFEFDGSEGPDWKNREQSKFSIIYSHSHYNLQTFETQRVRDIGQVYFPTKESCRAYIDSHQDDLKLLFGVE